MGEQKEPAGVLDKSYALGRQQKKSWRYRLNRRTREVAQAIESYYPLPVSILDLGAAEGAMLSRLKKHFPQARCLGIEYSRELISINQDKEIEIIQGDIQKIPFDNESFDVAVATAVIEHLPQPLAMVSEARRVLKKNGLFILTTPDPFFDKIADFLSKDETAGHQETFDLTRLRSIFEKYGFRVMKAEKFMVSPMGMPGELAIEKIFRLFKINFLMLNQIIVGQK